MTSSNPTTSGEGERRAIRGYVSQYGIAAGIIYERICSGDLAWVGLADRSAGSFDDIVLGLRTRVVAYQIKSRRDPGPFGFDALLLGADKLLEKLVNAWKKLQVENGSSAINLVFLTADFPRPTDTLTDRTKPKASSAAFCRTHQANHRTWTPDDWRRTAFRDFWNRLQAASGLGEDGFAGFWQSIEFQCGATRQGASPLPATLYDQRRIDELASLLPRLVADDADKDRWTTAELIERLNWWKPAGLFHPHIFPIDSAVQSNPVTEDALSNALTSYDRGYLSLLGPPGSGKSTLLQASLLPTPKAAILRYLAFIPNEGHGLGRAEAIDFLHDIVSQLNNLDLGPRIFPGSDLPELRSQLERLLDGAADRYRRDGIKTIIVIDGLDHVPREEKPTRSLLTELPQPNAVPTGVLILLGSQRLELEGMPPAVSDEAGKSGRRFDIAPLPKESIVELAKLAKLPTDVDLHRLYAASAGHPLSARYLIAALVTATRNEAETILSDDHLPGRDVEAFYQRAWRELAINTEAQNALAYIALAEGSVAAFELDKLVGSNGTDAAWNAAAHLLRMDENSRLSIFHNSFRLFLFEKTNIRFGRRDDTILRKRYVDLANLSKGCGEKDPQRWLELRYRARAHDNAKVLELATPDRFRNQFIERRNPNDIQIDIRLAFRASADTRNSEKLFELILARHEIETRSSAIEVDTLLNAYIAVGDLDSANGIVNANIPISAGTEFRLVDALLAAGRIEEARSLFDSLEPTNKLYGSEAIDTFQLDDELDEWAARALVFRAPRHFLAALDRLRMPATSSGWSYSLDDIRNHLKFTAARNALETGSAELFASTVESLALPNTLHPSLRVLAAEAAAESNDEPAARTHLLSACEGVESLSEDQCQRAALLCLKFKERSTAEKYFHCLAAPAFDRGTDPDGGFRRAREIFNYALIEAHLTETPIARKYATSALFSAFQRKLEGIGKLAAEGLIGKSKSPDVVWRELNELLAFIRVRPVRGGFDSERWEIEKSIGTVARIIVRTANHHGKRVLARVISEIDALLMQEDIGQLGFFGFRKAYAFAVYDIDLNTEAALKRLQGIGEFGGEQTPQEFVQSAAEAAEAFALVGDTDSARKLLDNIYQHTLGIMAPAKKDGQYELWRELYKRACAEEPAANEKRIRFFSRLLEGLSQTEGRGAAGRVAVDHLVEAARFSPLLGHAVCKQLQECRLLTWPMLLGGLLLGTAYRNKGLSVAAERIFARTAIPFMSDFNDDILATLLELTPSPEKPHVLAHAIRCIETDAEASIRGPLLNQLNGTAARFGLAVPQSILERWKDEINADAQSSMDGNPFAGVSSLEELLELIPRVDSNKSYYAIGAFIRLAPTSPLDLIKKVVALPDIAGNDRALHAAALAALAAGDLDYVQTLKSALEATAIEHGSWGNWQSGAKFRLHSLFVALEGEPAKVRAFDLFAQDLAQGHEWTVSLLPNLVEIFEILSPRPSWSAMWEVLTRHLEQFRDYQSGKELNVEGFESDEELYADLIFRGLELALNTMSWQCRLAALDLISISNEGPAIIQTLIKKLSETPGDMKLHAIRIAWECRNCPALRELFILTARQMVTEDDLALVVLGRRLGLFFGIELEPPDRPLPAYYSLTLPPDPQADRFDAPSGYSPHGNGLWTEDVTSWTWPLQRPLRLLTTASNFDLSKLRRRVGELMRRNGGRDSFGPEVTEARSATLRRLDLEVMYQRLPVLAAFRGFRQLCCELATAGECDPMAFPMLLSESGGPAYLLRTFEAEPRPDFIERSQIIDAFGREEVTSWLEAGESAATWPSIKDRVLVASTALFDRVSYRRKRSEERLLLPYDKPIVADDLFGALAQLPTIRVVDGMVTLYDGIAESGVACVREDIAGSIPDNLLMLCPHLAIHVGLSHHPSDPFAYVNQDGTTAVRTISWRDGGIARYGGDRSVRGDGCAIIATHAAFEAIKTHLGRRRCTHVWRSSTNDDRPTEVNTGRFAAVIP